MPYKYVHTVIYIILSQSANDPAHMYNSVSYALHDNTCSRRIFNFLYTRARMIPAALLPRVQYLLRFSAEAKNNVE